MSTTTALAPHPLADLIPSMTEAEYCDLLADIKANGLREPITLYEGQILDGRNRARACEELSVKPASHDYDGDDPAKFVISLNVHRRHLTTSQRAEIALAVLPHYKKQAEKRMKAGKAPSDQKTQGFRARDAAAADVGVAGITVARLERVAREAPDLHKEVKAGKKHISKAWEETRAREQPKSNGKVELGTERQRLLAERAKHRAEKVVGTCNGLARGLEHIKVPLAVAVTTPEELKGWDDAFRSAQSALGRLRKQIKELA